jgi:tRNA G46 methylase TrmB
MSGQKLQKPTHNKEYKPVFQNATTSSPHIFLLKKAKKFRFVFSKRKKYGIIMQNTFGGSIMYQLLDVAKGFLESMNIKEDYVLCDFTMGNGYDTEYLCKKVPKGKVYAFDIQAQAVENTKKRLSDAGLTNAEIIHDSHAKVLDYVKEEINGGMFNLGYLPGGDK